MPGTITFKAAFGDEEKQVELSYLMGGYFHIYIDGFYKGQIHKRDGKWTVLLQDPDSMTIDDKDALVDRIEQHSID